MEKTITDVYFEKGRIKNIARLRDANWEELLELKGIIDVDIADIGAQLDRFKMEGNPHEEHDDPEWASHANTAKRLKRALSQQIEHQIAIINRREKKERKKEWRVSNQRHIDCLKKAMSEVLSEEDKEKVLCMTRELFGDKISNDSMVQV